MCKLLGPVLWYSLLSVVGTRDLTIDSPGGVRIVTKIYGEKAALTKRIARGESP
jgi:hypothetical protein